MSKQNETGFDEMTDEQLMALARQLPQDAAPAHDLWPGIEQAIAAVPASTAVFRQSLWAQAAAIVLLVAGSSGITWYATHDDTPVPATVVSMDQVFEPVSGDFGDGYTLGSEYLDVHQQLQGSLEEKLAALTPEARAEVVSNLNTIRRAIRDINDALAAEPDNVLLQDLLRSTYHDELNLMIRVNGIANAAMRRDDI
jgi:hypothetical protein